MVQQDIHTAKNGRRYIRLANGQTRFIADNCREPRPGKGVQPARVHRGTSRASGARVSIAGQPEVDFNERQIGTILKGFVEAGRGAVDDVERIFGEEKQQPRSEQLLLELGREVFQHLGVAFSFFKVSPEEWQSWFKTPGQKAATSSTMPFQMAATAWLPPVIGRITSRFGDARNGTKHEGVDVAVAVGTPVVAPVDLKIRDVNFGAKAGRFIVADAIRDNGSFDGDGYRLTFAHLSDAVVKEGQIVQRGTQIGTSGATGQATGPHLHFRTEWVDDGVFRDKSVTVDPLGLISEAVFTGAAAPMPIAGGQVGALDDGGKPINVIVAPGAGRVSIGHGLIQPDTDVRVQSPDTVLQNFIEDPFDGILHTASDVIQAVATPQNIRNAGNAVATVAKVIGVIQPETLPVAAPASIAGGVVAAAAEPISALAKGDNPLEGII